MKIVLYKPYDTLDKIISFFSRGNYSHVAIMMNDGSLIDIRPFKKIRKIPYIHYGRNQNQKVEIYNVVTTTQQDEIINDFLNKQIGKGYDYFSVFGFIINKSELGRKQYGKWFCSELVYCAFKKVNINLLERIKQWEVTPVILSYSNLLKEV